MRDRGEREDDIKRTLSVCLTDLRVQAEKRSRIIPDHTATSNNSIPEIEASNQSAAKFEASIQSVAEFEASRHSVTEFEASNTPVAGSQAEVKVEPTPDPLAVAPKDVLDETSIVKPSVVPLSDNRAASSGTMASVTSFRKSSSPSSMSSADVPSGNSWSVALVKRAAKFEELDKLVQIPGVVSWSGW